MKRASSLAAALAVIWLVVCSAPALAQGGYTTETHAEHGLRFPRARHYEEIPTRPNEEWVILRYVERKEQTEKAGRKRAPEMRLVRIDYVADPAPVTRGGDEEPPDERPDDTPDETPERGGGKKQKGAELPLNDFQRYLERRLTKWDVAEKVEGKAKGGWSPTEYRLEPDQPRSSLVGFAYVWESERVRTFAVLGFCHQDDYDEQSKIWRHTASRMKISDVGGAAASREREKWERFYDRRNYIDPEYRVEVRLGLADGWQAEDTENYIVIYSTDDAPLVRKVLRDLELIRKEYEKLFPPAAPVEAVSTVRVCKDRDEYHKFGGPGSSAGYWNYRDEELVFYDGTRREKGERTDRLDTFIVLYHEAFHQYIHYSAGELAPHSWYNEGYGDYFSGAVVSSGKLRKIGPNRWRTNTIKKAVEERAHVPWKDIIGFEQKDYYAKAGLCYAQGWSMIYFLETSPEVRRHPIWPRILSIYFDELKAAWAEELAQLERDGKADDPAARAAGQLQARVRAVDAAFTDVDLDEIEAAWIEFVEALEPVERWDR